MRRIQRVALPKVAARFLTGRQAAADEKRKQRKLDVTADWKGARQAKPMRGVLTSLQTMMGERQRCMYCLDSHGSDIEHFRPKMGYPARIYHWPNLLLCCTECGRLKGNQFPLAGRQALLIDPSREDPWAHLDFDPDTGNICARFDLGRNAWSAKGERTVAVLKLDQREALSAGYLQTLRRLSATVRTALVGDNVDADALMVHLQQADDHGLLPWCLSDRGRAIAPFCDLYQQHPGVWRQCRHALRL